MLSAILPQGSKRREVAKAFLIPKANIPAHLSRNYKSIDRSGFGAIESALKRDYFARSPSGYLETNQGNDDLRNHLFSRLEGARKQTIPWLDQAKPLSGANILEIGCGTGSDAVAFAEQGANVTAIDIDEDSLAVARERCNIYGVDVTLLTINATDVQKLFHDKHFDIVVFYASLEHMTHQERLIAMSSTWKMLIPGALWCVVETPNRLWYYDSHTALLPFFHWLPDELAFKYSSFSPRSNFRELYREENEANMHHFLRRGRGVSFHEFGLAMKRVEELDVVSCKSMFIRQRNYVSRLRWRLSLEYQYESILARICPQIHRGFFQRSLELIIRKD